MLIINITVIIPRIIFCVLCPPFSWQCSHSHLQSFRTRYQEKINIHAENMNNQGSNQWGINSACANSGAKSDNMDNTIGNTQQKRCGSMLAMIPIFIALFFMKNSFIFWYPQQESNLYQRFRKPLFYPVELWGQ